MKKASRLILLWGWVTVTTLIVTRLWLTHPDHFPRLPDTFWIQLIDVFGSADGEDLANLELIVVLTMSFFLTLILTLLIRAMERRIRHYLGKQGA